MENPALRDFPIYIGISMSSKQVLVMKKFPKDRNMRTGKYVAQGAHASLGALLSLGKMDPECQNFVISLENPFVYEWLIGRFTKVTVYVETDDELAAICNKAKEAGIATALITDAGLTEFNGVPTITAVGVGPDDPEKINAITGHLPLF
jgi:peptidyl-tRNA hydrolase, PTH2 family